jgi:hypothetical protein
MLQSSKRVRIDATRQSPLTPDLKGVIDSLMASRFDPALPSGTST